jgi:RNA 3'-terminal phosphate cyclase
MTDEKRKQLKDKVAAGEARHRDLGRTTFVDRAGETAIEAKDKFVAFVKEHPIATVTGAVALGVLVSGLFKRSPTRKAGARASAKAASLATIGAELALAYAQQAMAAASDVSRAGADKLGDLGSSARHLSHDAADKLSEIGSSARHLGHDAADRAGDLGATAKSAARDASRRFSKALRNRIN